MNYFDVKKLSRGIQEDLISLIIERSTFINHEKINFFNDGNGNDYGVY